MEAAWKLLQDWPISFIQLTWRVGLQHHLAARIGSRWVFWMAEGIDRLPGCRQRQLNVTEAEAVTQWLVDRDEAPTWNRILSVAGVSTPTRVPQPGVLQVLERIAKRHTEQNPVVTIAPDLGNGLDVSRPR